jgi:hypothetical protein|tara:strand:- start:435 stop:953 length:519 start_codon:yes stop_codon:yes gene_type:complete
VAGKLVQIATNTVTSAVGSVTLTGINTDDVYMLSINNVVAAVDGKQLTIRVTAGGTAKTTSDYDQALKALYTQGSFINQGNVNLTGWLDSTFSSGNGTGESDSGIVYLYNFANSSEYSHCSFEMVKVQLTPYLAGEQGGGVYTVAEAHDGVLIRYSDGTNISSGTFTLYKVI